MKKIYSTILLATAIATQATLAEKTRVYFGTSGSKGIYFADLDTESGLLSTPQLALEIAQPGFLTTHPAKPILYAASFEKGGSAGQVVALTINSNGTLTILNKQSSKGRNPCHVSIDATGQCLMVANYGSGSVAAFQIAEDGSLSEARSIQQHAGKGEHPKRQQGPHAHSIFPNPENTFAYSPDLGIDQVMIYKLDAENGTLSEPGHAVVPGGSMGPRHMKWSADGKYAYVLNELDVSLSVFRKGQAAGSLEFIQTISVLPDAADKQQMSCAEIRIHPSGKFIYTSTRDLTEQGRDSISTFTPCFNLLATAPIHLRIGIVISIFTAHK